MTDSDRATGHDAWAVEVIQANGADLLSYLTRRTSPPADAADVLSNVLVVLWNRRKDIPHEAESAGMWSFGVARNALRDYRRQGVRRAALADALRNNLESLTLERVSDPLEATDRTRRGEAVRSAVARLSKPYRELIMLVHWDEFSMAQAATLLGVNPSTARSRYARARQRLATELTDHHEAADSSSSRGMMRLTRPVDNQPESSG